MDMRILVTGSNGQVARSIRQIGSAHPHLEIVCTTRDEMDLENTASIRPAIAAAKPDIVIHAAAYTAVDQAEDEPERAHQINAVATGEIARATADVGIPVIYLSTDYVFDGTKPGPYVESDPVNPVTVYGRTKLEGERLVAMHNPRHAILRTAWVYSPYGKNFLALAETRDRLTVVNDQHGNPTSALDIAQALLAHIVPRLVSDSENNALHGVFHLAGEQSGTWHDFAKAIFEHSASRSGPSAEVSPVTSAEFPTKAQRPANSRLNTAKLRSAYGHSLPGYSDAIPKVLDQLLPN